MDCVRSFLKAVILPLCFLMCCPAWAAKNAIEEENSKRGTTDWELTSFGSPAVVGYASSTSVGAGETLKFYISSWAPQYRLSVYRIGWYGGAGGRLMTSVVLPGKLQAVPVPDGTTGLIDCKWEESWRLTIPHQDWTTGVYLAKLTPSSGAESYIMFVVRDNHSKAPYVFLSGTNTFQAYNAFGGKSLYDYNSFGGRARKVSFNRPYGCAGPSTRLVCGAAEFFRWEIYLLRFLERNGYDVSYISDTDLHTDGMELLDHNALLVAGHDEYWTYEMKAALHTAQANGVHLGFFTSNAIYWQVRLESSAAGAPNRTLVAYKETATTEDPVAKTRDKKLLTTRFRDLPALGVSDTVAAPENGLIGVMYVDFPVFGDIVVSDASSWVFVDPKHGVSNGTHLYGLLGYEVDAIVDNGYSPPQLRKIADSPYRTSDARAHTGSSHMVTYTTQDGAIVFATGSMQWSWGLDNYLSLNFENDAAKLATRNVLARFAAPPLAAPTNVLDFVESNGIIVSWRKAKGANSYNIYRSKSADEFSTVPYRTGIVSTTFLDTAPDAKTYHYRVSAVNDVTESAQSNVATPAKWNGD